MPGQGARDRWSGGQVSLVRGLLGLLVAATAPLADPTGLPGELEASLLLLRVALGLLLALGAADRSAAAVLLAVLGWRLAHLSPLELALVPSLALHLWTPPAPYGSLAMRRRTDPGGSWRLPAGFVPVARVLAIGGLLAAGWAGEPGAVVGLAPLLVLALDPGWLPPRADREVVFFDGDCGLCHRTVRLLLAEDPGGGLRFAPLQGTTFAREVPAERRATLPDSVLVRTADGRLLTRSEGIAHLLVGLGGLWRVAGHLLGAVPRPLRDAGYDGVARVRRRLFRAPTGLCPVVPPELGERFLP